MKLPNLVTSETTPETYSAQATIFEAGKPGNTMYIVSSGQVDLLVGEKVVETVDADGFFGEMALIDNQPRSATAIARTDCQLLPIDQRKFLFMVDETPFFAIVVMRKMSERLRRLNQQNHA